MSACFFEFGKSGTGNDETRVYKFRRVVGCGLLAGALIPALATAAPVPTIHDVKFSGSGCSDADSTYVFDTRTGDFEARFSNLFAATPAGDEDYRDCTINVKVQPPQGFALSIAGATLEGAARVTGDGEVKIKQSYSIRNAEGALSELKDTYSSSNDPNFHVGSEIQAITQTFGIGVNDPASIPAEWMGKCGAVTEIMGTLNLGALGRDSGETEVYADRTRVAGAPAGARKGRMLWDWVLIPCGNGGGNGGGGGNAKPLDGRWGFHYLAANGRTLKGKMNVAGDKGTYRVEGASWTGSFSGLRSDDGNVIGTWEALGNKGWVRFSPASDGQSFTGEWGYQGADATGFWNGQRE